MMTFVERIDTIAAHAADIGAPGVNLGHSLGTPGLAGELAKLAGAVRHATIIHTGARPPYVIEVVTVERWGLSVRAQWDRPASPEEIALLEHQVEGGTATTHRDDFLSVSLPPGGDTP